MAGVHPEHEGVDVAGLEPELVNLLEPAWTKCYLLVNYLVGLGVAWLTIPVTYCTAYLFEALSNIKLEFCEINRAKIIFLPIYINKHKTFVDWKLDLPMTCF